MKLIKNIYLVLFFLSLNHAFAQNLDTAQTAEDASLKIKFEELVEKSETFQDYKVIRRELLTSFWTDVNDSLELYAKGRVKLESDLQIANKSISELEIELKKTQADLEQVTFQRDRISFLGIELIKNNYSYLVWGIILVLMILIVVAYARYLGANRTTDRVKKESAELELELEEFKKSAREKETKLRRELQTEINTVEELKQKVTLPKR